MFFKGRKHGRNKSAVSVKKIYISEDEIFVNPKFQIIQSACSVVSPMREEEAMIILAKFSLIVYRNHAI